MEVTEEMWSLLQAHLGYTDEEIKVVKENPRFEQVLSRVPELASKTIIFEVVQSHGCNSQHKVGDRFYLDGAGNFLTRQCPKRMCSFLTSSMGGMVFGAHEMLYAGVDPNKMCFKRGACQDVGVNCGGWGRVVYELKVEDRKEAN